MYTVFGAPDELGLHFKTVKGITNCAQSPSGTPNTAYVQPGPALQSKKPACTSPKRDREGGEKNAPPLPDPPGRDLTNVPYNCWDGDPPPQQAMLAWMLTSCCKHAVIRCWWFGGGCLENILGNLPVKRTLSAPPLRVMIDVYVEGRRLNYRNQMVHF